MIPRDFEEEEAAAASSLRAEHEMGASSLAPCDPVTDESRRGRRPPRMNLCAGTPMLQQELLISVELQWDQLWCIDHTLNISRHSLHG